MAIFNYDEQTAIFYEIYGSGDRPVLFLHGFGDSGETWKAILPFVAKGRRLYVLDLRGCGRSSKPRDGRYSIQDHAAMVSAFLVNQGLETVSVVGHSMGGAVALRLALTLQFEHPEKISRLILMDAAGLPQKVPGFVWVPALPLLGPLLLYAIPARVQAFLSIRPLYKVAGSYGPERSRRYARALRSAGGVRALVMTARSLIAEDAARWMEEVCSYRGASSIIWGAEDPAIPLQNGYILQKIISGSDLTVVPSCGHVTQEEAPEVVGPLLDRLLTH